MRGIEMIRTATTMLIAVAFMFVARPGESKPVKKGDGTPAEFLIDFSPVAKATGSLDCKITFVCETVKGDKFERGLTIKGPVTKNTAEDMATLLKTLFEAQSWDAKEMEKTKLHVSGKKGSLVAKIEMRVEKLGEDFYPTITQKKPEKK
jgi:hypothetical protein